MKAKLVGLTTFGMLALLFAGLTPVSADEVTDDCTYVGNGDAILLDRVLAIHLGIGGCIWAAKAGPFVEADHTTINQLWNTGAAGGDRTTENPAHTPVCASNALAYICPGQVVVAHADIDDSVSDNVAGIIVATNSPGGKTDESQWFCDDTAAAGLPLGAPVPGGVHWWGNKPDGDIAVFVGGPVQIALMAAAGVPPTQCDPGVSGTIQLCLMHPEAGVDHDSSKDPTAASTNTPAQPNPHVPTNTRATIRTECAF